MKVVIRNLSTKAMKEMAKELGNPKMWLEDADVSKEYEGCVNITLTDGVMIKTHFDTIIIDCGAHLYFLEQNDFEKVVIV